MGTYNAQRVDSKKPAPAMEVVRRHTKTPELQSERAPGLVHLARIATQSGNAPSPEAHAAALADLRLSGPARTDLVRQLQQSYGNRYVQRLVQRISQTRVQTKLTVGPAGDKYEQEADRVAKEVMGTIGSADREVAQRQNPEEDDELQMQPAARRQVPMEGGGVDPEVENTIQQAKGGGKSLPDNVRSSMERSFGADFSGVRVHDNAEADALNNSMSSTAFTTGQDIFFRQGKYSPGSSGGQELLAHELTHVVQQNGAGDIRRQESPEVGFVEQPGAFLREGEELPHSRMGPTVLSDKSGPVENRSFLRQEPEVEFNSPSTGGLVIQRQIRIEGKEITPKEAATELKGQSLVLGIKDQDLDQILTRFDFQMRRFKDYRALADAVFVERDEDRKYAQDVFKRLANEFLATYKTVGPGGGGGTTGDGPMSMSELKEMAKEIAQNVADEFKRNPKEALLRAAGFGGPAAMIESEVLEGLRPYMPRSLESMVPMDKSRKKFLTGVEAFEGIFDIVYNSCGLVVEFMTAEAAAPVVAGVGGGYKGFLSAVKSKIKGKSKVETRIEALTTVAAETAQGLIPIGGSAMGIGGGVKQLGDISKDRIKKAIRGGYTKVDPEMLGDSGVLVTLDELTERVDALIERGEAWAPKSGELTKLLDARKWLWDQATKTEELWVSTEKKGKMPLLFQEQESEWY